MVGAKIETTFFPPSLLRFLALWLATYLIPFLAASAVRLAVLFGTLALDPPLARYASAIVWVSLLPVGLATGQWILMRSYVAKPVLWSVATLAGALLAQASTTIIPAAQTSSFGLLPQLFGLYEALRSIFGSDVATYALIMFPIASCYGAAWSIPQGIALPGSRSAKVVWIIVLMLTGFVVVVMAETFSYELREAFSLRRHPDLIVLLASNLVPLSFGWLILALVSGSIMYWNLWRNAEAETTQVLA